MIDIMTVSFAFRLLLFNCLLFCISCQQQEKSSVQKNRPWLPLDSMYRDPHSYSNPEDARITHLDLDIIVDFEKKILKGIAHFDIEVRKGNKIVLDTRDLKIDKIWLDQDTTSVVYQEGEYSPIFGKSITIPLTEHTKKLHIAYETKPGAAALLWCDPPQTRSKKFPFLFTQGQAILTRTWIPIQDSPGNKITYSASVQVPSGMLALMSAGNNPQQTKKDGIYHFEQKNPISPYLIALTCGDLRFVPIGSTTGVYCESDLTEQVRYEFSDMQSLVDTASRLFGTYDWGRYDMIILPPGFPFGGMENPNLTFATPTIIAGDKSLISLVSHELAHSWSGNTVTNATWNDFWLNEGFTMYLERRISEAMYGKEFVDMNAVIGFQELSNTLKVMASTPEDTKLKLNLQGRDPDEGLTDIAYEKGYLFLYWLESVIGRHNMEKMLQEWFRKNKGGVVITEDFIRHLKESTTLSPTDEARMFEWIYQAGIPEFARMHHSDKFDQVDLELNKIVASGYKKLPASESWSAWEWLHFIRHLPLNTPHVYLKELDHQFALSRSKNNEIRGGWLLQCQLMKYSIQDPSALDDFLIQVGRRKFLTPIYEQMVKNGQSTLAKKIFMQAAPGYHAITRESIREILNTGNTGH